MVRRDTPDMSLLYLNASDIERVRPPIDGVIAVVETALRAHALGRAYNPPKVYVQPRPDARVTAMPGFIPEMHVAGVKCIAGYPTNPARGLPYVVGMMVLQDPDTGLPYALLECGWLTAARTAAATALFVRECAHTRATTVALLGAGVQARAILPALIQSCPNVRRVVVSSRTIDGAVAFCRDMQPSSPVELVARPAAREAVQMSDVVVETVPPLPTPVVENAWFRPGALLVSVGYGFGADQRHFVDRMIVADAQQTMALAKGSVPAIYAELGEILIGRKPARQSDAERIYANVNGLAIFDLALGQLVFQRAREAGVGVRLTLF